MPNIFLKIKSWQLSWLKRSIINPNAQWLVVINKLLDSVKLQDLMSSSLDKNSSVLQKLPTFYKNILLNWNEVKNEYGKESINDVLLWHNNNITINNKPFFWKSQYDNGIKFIRDIIDAEGNFLSSDEISKKHEVQCNFLTALQIRQAIPFIWRDKLRKMDCTATTTEPLLQFSNICTATTLTKLKSRQLYYWILDSNRRTLDIKPACIFKWDQCYNINEDDWKKVFSLPFKTCRSTILQTLQYRLLHRIITCNVWLYKAKIKVSPVCDYCDENDTLEHFFIHCDGTKLFWSRYIAWWNTLSRGTDYVLDTMNDKEILFGFLSSRFHVVNEILILAKKIIHDNKMAGLNVSFLHFLVVVKHHVTYVKEICYRNNQLELFERHWNWLYVNV